MPTKKDKDKTAFDKKRKDLQESQEIMDKISAELSGKKPADATSETGEVAEGEKEAPKKAKKIRARGKKYQEKRSLVDKTKEYSVAEAVALIKKMSFSKFGGSVEAHLEVREAGTSATLTFPHSTGKTLRVAVVSDDLLADLAKGVINFDMLVARPEDMRNLTKYARVLGPKGLMPNPKNGTVTPNPEKKKKDLEGGAVTLKTEKKAPLIHLTVGKLAMKDKEIEENIAALVKAFDTKAVRLYIAASMSPSVRVKIVKALE